MLKNFKKRKKNNKGFTLVELVVVIAILAILVGLLVPQYTKYVDKARKSSDASNLANMVRAVEIAAADPNGKLQPGKITIELNTEKVKITVAGLKDGENANNTVGTVIGVINDTMGADTVNEDTTKAGSVKLKSTSWKTPDNKITADITIDKDYAFTTDYSKNVKEYIATK